MALTLDQALGQLDISIEAFQRAELADSVLPAAGPGQVHFIAVMSGSGNLFTSCGPIAVSAGQLFLMPGAVAPEFGPNLTLAHGLLEATLLNGSSMFDFLQLPHCFEAAGTELFTGAIPELLHESAYGGPGSSAIITCLARRLVTVLVRDAWPQDENIKVAILSNRLERLNKIVGLMKKDPGRDYTLENLADIAGMSRTMFHREFTEAYGNSPLTILRTLRLKRAEDLLERTDMPIKTIMARLGYRSRSHFCKLFKDAWGIDPEQFRKRQKNKISF